MLFNSYQFAIFFAAFFACYVALGRKGQNVLILIASGIFYGAWDWRFLGLLGFTICVDFMVTRQLDLEIDPRRRWRLLCVSLFANLGMLAFFKYFDFFAANLHDLMTALGIPLSTPVLHVILPVGISFYTLHTLGYVLDVYHRRQPHVSSFVEFACFVSFFPLLVAGPIVRVAFMRDQFASPRSIMPQRIWMGLSLCLIGLFQKVVIADNLGFVVDHAFSTVAQQKPADLLIGLYAFAFQIYADFAGYSNMAIGLAAVLGFTIPPNFERPYFATSIRDFWRRWHISLSTWIRDYVYVPLGGNRTGHTFRNLMVTMGLCGLWHGASWTMVLWGFYHGLLLSGEHAVSSVIEEGTKRWSVALRMGTAVAMMLITFHLVCLGWLLFRAPSLADAMHYAAGIVRTPAEWSLRTLQMNSKFALGFIVLAIALDLFHVVARRPDFFVAWPPYLRGAAVGVLIGALCLFGGFIDAPFIYFQF